MFLTMAGRDEDTSVASAWLGIRGKQIAYSTGRGSLRSVPLYLPLLLQGSQLTLELIDARLLFRNDAFPLSVHAGYRRRCCGLTHTGRISRQCCATRCQ